MPLTVVSIQNAKASRRPAKLFDGGGLFLLVTPSGNKWWRFKYRFGGKEKLLSLGVYPEVSLLDARQRRDEERRKLAHHIDPAANRKAAKAAWTDGQANTFEMVAREWIASR